MSLFDSAETAFLKLVFQAIAWGNMADNAASSPLTNLYASLHTASPGEGGNQSTNEISYTGYARVAVARTSGGWTVVGNLTNVSTVSFGLMTAGAGGIVTHAAIGFLASGAGAGIFFDVVSPNITVVNGVSPALSPAQLSID